MITELGLRSVCSAKAQSINVECDKNTWQCTSFQQQHMGVQQNSCLFACAAQQGKRQVGTMDAIMQKWSNFNWCTDRLLPAYLMFKQRT
jgi:hypothetical protein